LLVAAEKAVWTWASSFKAASLRNWIRFSVQTTRLDQLDGVAPFGLTSPGTN
jgi:hypothetical protein